MAARNNKLTELTDIPLTIDQQGDSIEMTSAAKADKTKSNSLKRFFRIAKNSMSTSKSLDSADAVCESEMKNIRSFQLRFGSFHKNDEEETPKSSIEPGSSAEALKSKLKENRLGLQGRVANYWSTAFKKSLKKPLTNENVVQTKESVALPLNDTNKIESNQSGSL